MAKKQKGEGTCKLTKTHGRFVDSHLLPKALTKADGLGPGLVQFGYGRKERRLSSWYDRTLVVEAGEKVLAEYDSFAIPSLRRHKLVWSGWGPMQTLAGINSIPGTPWGIRKIDGDVAEWRRIRLFCLSLLWRAAATDRWEFDQVKLTAEDLEQLREMVLTGNPEPLAFYPVTLTQLSTIGWLHNHAPIAFTKHTPAIGEVAAQEIPTIRFYLDGLILHFSALSVAENAATDLTIMRVGEDDSLTLSTVTFEGSAQAENLAIIGLEAELGRPLFEIERGPFT